MKPTLIALLALCLCVTGCATLNDVGKRLWGADKKTEPIVSPNWTSDPSDPNNVMIEAAIRNSLKKPTGELTKVDLEKVTTLYLSGNQLTEVPKGLEKLTQLMELNLANNQLTDVSALANLTQLTGLVLINNQLTDVNGLEKLTKLEGLVLWNNQLTDVKGLEKLTKLEALVLVNNQLTDVKGLEKLTQLTNLSLSYNKLTDV